VVVVENEQPRRSVSDGQNVHLVLEIWSAALPFIGLADLVGQRPPAVLRRQDRAAVGFVQAVKGFSAEGAARLALRERIGEIAAGIGILAVGE
jgi:hypothetical protein